MSDKQKLRLEYLEKRKSISQDEMDQISTSITSKIIEEVDFKKFNYVHVFIPILERNEINAYKIINALKLVNPDINIVIPKMIGKRKMLSLQYDSSTVLRKNQYGILEPEEEIEVDEKLIDVVIVPLLVFDLMGNRIGYGKGFYDEFLSNCRMDTLRIGVSAFEPVEKISSVDDWDLPLTHCATAKTYYRFNI